MKYDELSLILRMAVYVVDTVSQLNFLPPKGSWSERHTCNMAQFELGSEAQWSKRLPRSIFYR